MGNQWYDANQQYLSASIALIRHLLEQYSVNSLNPADKLSNNDKYEQALQKAAEAMPAPSALERICQIFDLSAFERDVLLLCAAMELSNDFASVCSAAQPEGQKAYPTLGLALAALPNPHWDAIAPYAPLRRWRLIQIGEGHALTLCPLRIDERILHYLVGIQYLDERLSGMIEPLQSSNDLVPSHQTVAEKAAAVLLHTPTTGELPSIQFYGIEYANKRDIAVTVCEMLGLQLNTISAQVVPVIPNELDNFIRLWNREILLNASALLINCDELDTSDVARLRAIAHLIERLNGVLMITSRERMTVKQRPTVSFDIHKPTLEEQGAVWREALSDLVPQLNGSVNTLVNQFNLNTVSIQAACAEVAGHLSQKPENDINNILWDVCRIQARPRLDELAQRIEPAAGWEDLVLPPLQKQILHEVAAHVRQRSTVYESWGFGGKSARGLGITALFAGASGTGKTLAAEVLANELRLDLYRIDLSSVISKYIGETEKNLRQVFDTAEEGGVILLFDEADALFGKRSEVKDSRDRHANIEVSYLLQRMEAYPGLAVLTTNLKSSIDTAFLRRIRFVLQFPFPDAIQRAEIWRRVFPTSTPTQGLDAMKLAKLNVAGGNIRNIALNAAFLAADARESVQMKHLLRAAQSEYSKLEKPLTDAEVGSWT
ncbi:ATP-binding protein (plasmid) [Brasilonema octagenarum UFV-E1]|uniref:ATP-binding protein n=2 Tax=Brasilonema TaxID=383614 RepID=A0A856MU22_9CYAN|nr:MULTISPECIES: ATP-binding protein [Brasilonema]NMF62512.1 ATP-binding protein [Brasilonema octagenarum UFV-OR1]QDL12766.1 ATP-binding protein [Brasilonema sennae CENA114]QDL19162.1 ATP-binding protein [Brasilonema octagenarum UFV-E1]